MPYTWCPLAALGHPCQSSPQCCGQESPSLALLLSLSFFWSISNEDWGSESARALSQIADGTKGWKNEGVKDEFRRFLSHPTLWNWGLSFISHSASCLY